MSKRTVFICIVQLTSCVFGWTLIAEWTLTTLWKYVAFIHMIHIFDVFWFLFPINFVFLYRFFLSCVSHSHTKTTTFYRKMFEWAMNHIHKPAIWYAERITLTNYIVEWTLQFNFEYAIHVSDLWHWSLVNIWQTTTSNIINWKLRLKISTTSNQTAT